MLCIAVPKILLLIHILNFFVFTRRNGIENVPTLLFQSCLDPYAEHNIALYKIMPIDLILLYVYHMAIIGSNVYLYLYLKKQTENNIALKDADKRKEKRRNFVPAQSGIFVTAEVAGIFKIFPYPFR